MTAPSLKMAPSTCVVAYVALWQKRLEPPGLAQWFSTWSRWTQ